MMSTTIMTRYIGSVARIPGNGEPAKAPIAIEASVDTIADEPIL